MELTAMDIYLVMQSDSIAVAFNVVGVVFSVIFGVGALRSTVAWSGGDSPGWPLILLWPAFGLSLMIAIGSAFIPSTKTAATMYVVPAIVNNETLQEDAGEFYELAKDALRDAIGNEGTPDE